MFKKPSWIDNLFEADHNYSYELKLESINVTCYRVDFVKALVDLNRFSYHLRIEKIVGVAKSN